MYIFGGSVDIPRPGNWPEGIDFPAQARILSVHFDSDHYQRNRTGMNWNILIQTDETSIPNQTRCVDVFNRYSSPTDVYGLSKYYCLRADGKLYERFDWRPAAQGSYTPDPNRDIQIVFARSTERTDFDDNYSRRQGLITTIRTVPALNLETAYLYLQQLAEILENQQRFESRRLRPDQ